eukprot:Gb_34843 [translate_table: standard]
MYFVRPRLPLCSSLNRIVTSLHRFERIFQAKSLCKTPTTITQRLYQTFLLPCNTALIHSPWLLGSSVRPLQWLQISMFEDSQGNYGPYCYLCIF